MRSVVAKNTSQQSLDEEKGEILVEYGRDVGCVTPVLKNQCSSDILPKKRSMTRCGWSLVCGALLPRTRHQQSLDEEKGEILVEYGHDVGCVTAVLKNPYSFDPRTLVEEKDEILLEYGHDVGCVTAVLKNQCSSEILPQKRSMTRCGWSLICVIDTLDSKIKVSTGNADTSSAVVQLAEEIDVLAPWPMTSSCDKVWRATLSVSLDQSNA